MGGQAWETKRSAFPIRGLVDCASPLGARWLDDDACSDEFARTLNRAQAALWAESTLPRRDGKGQVGAALWDAGGSPSLVWHAQAIGFLLEFGFLPTGDAIRGHLEVMDWRLHEANCVAPADSTPSDPWLLRSRHVAWTVACLAEMPQFTLSGREGDEERKRLEVGRQLHRKVIRRALGYLLDDSKGPGRWTALADDGVWHEQWEEREGQQPNMLNTIYASIALARADRHGYLRDDDQPQPVPDAFDILEPIFSSIEVVSPAGHPEVRWKEWHGPEPWAEGDLPDGVVGLLTLALLEYASLLQEATEPGTLEEQHGVIVRDKARRLAQVLLFRACDQSAPARSAPRWWHSFDGFLWQGAEGEWAVPSHSLCLRALLESGVASPRHQVVRNALATLDALRYEYRSTDSWFDPSRPGRVRRDVRSAGKERWHAKIDIDPLLPGGAHDSTRRTVTPAGLHAAAMAWAAYRRASASVDPHELLEPKAALGLGDSIFRTARFSAQGNRFALTLRTNDDPRGHYSETLTISPETRLVVRALADLGRPATWREIADKVEELAPGGRRVKGKSGVASRINKINRQLGAVLIRSNGSRDDKQYELGVALARERVRDSRSG